MYRLQKGIHSLRCPGNRVMLFDLRESEVTHTILETSSLLCVFSEPSNTSASSSGLESPALGVRIHFSWQVSSCVPAQVLTPSCSSLLAGLCLSALPCCSCHHPPCLFGVRSVTFPVHVVFYYDPAIDCICRVLLNLDSKDPWLPHYAV